MSLLENIDRRNIYILRSINLRSLKRERIYQNFQFGKSQHNQEVEIKQTENNMNINNIR